MKIKIINYTPDPEKHIEYCGRTCYDSRDKITENSSEKFVSRLIKSGHLSVLEHASVSIEITGVSRNLTHQLVRHRLCSYSQSSQRYIKIDNIKYVTPKKLSSGLTGFVYKVVTFLTGKAYKWFLKRGVPAEDARYILTSATHSTIVMSGNFRTWLEFLPKRLDTHAQWEIRVMAKEIQKELNSIAPNVFSNTLSSS